ncbi:hypothetical protein [Nocardioides sp. CFH 31398]|uniref:hypothetical protein n=1 Tax=Nocardioides sp. CFH 31398 TaxID=2919579 RepID=UPI001F053E09|nr:hypothetical protein [Nocardioides sp. CFH 31398]MCH1865038.1 hypothetical protein [Nocardioides sp. CFH 31398]
MSEPTLWWHHHRMTAPSRGPHQRFVVGAHPWGATLWDCPTRREPDRRLRVVEVAVAEPGASVDAAVHAALDHVPSSRWRAAWGRWGWFGLARRPAGRTAKLPFTGRIHLADALSRRAASHQMPHAPEVTAAVRAALWGCRSQDSRTSSALNRWLADVDRADEAATGVVMYARSMAGAAPGGHRAVVDRAASLTRDLVAVMAAGSETTRREAVAQLRDLRDGCREAHAAREALEAGLARAARGPGVPDLRLAAADAERDERRHRVGEVLRDLRAEAVVLREVDAELRDTKERPTTAG